VEPLLAVYEPTIREEIENRVRRRRFGLRYLAESSGVCTPKPPKEIHDAWINVNTMEEFERSVVIDV
jgi:molybdopterin-guanine dinucleotide biosynthesis protein A